MLNLSLGGRGSSAALAAALDYAFARDVVVVACTGNITPSSPTEVWYPAREPGVLAVAGLDPAGATRSGRIRSPAPRRCSRSGYRAAGCPARRLLAGAGHQLRRAAGDRHGGADPVPLAAHARGDVINRLIRTAREVGRPGRDDRTASAWSTRSRRSPREFRRSPATRWTTAAARGRRVRAGAGATGAGRTPAPKPGAERCRERRRWRSRTGGTAGTTATAAGPAGHRHRRLPGAHRPRRVCRPALRPGHRIVASLPGDDPAGRPGWRAPLGAVAGVALVVPAGGGDPRGLGGGHREAGVRVVGRRREDDAEHRAVGETSGPPELPLRTSARIV